MTCICQFASILLYRLLEFYWSIYRDFIVPRLCLNVESLIEHYNEPFFVSIYRYMVLL